MVWLVLSLIALLGPPALARGFARRPTAAALLDGMVVAGIGSIVALEVLPEAVEEAGLAALAALAIGLALPWAAERLGFGDGGVDRMSLLLGQSMLLVHAGLDGLALATAAVTSPALIVAVVLHQVPVGLAVWASAAARQGVAAAWFLLATMGVVTTVAFWAGAGAMDAAPPQLVGIFEAAAAGTLLHVVNHGGLPGAARHPRLGGAAAILTLGTAALLHATFVAPHPAITDLWARFADAAPAWLVGVALAAGVRAAGGPTLPFVAVLLAIPTLGAAPAAALAVASLLAWVMGPREPGARTGLPSAARDALLASGAPGLAGVIGAALLTTTSVPPLPGTVAVLLAALLATVLRAGGPGMVLLAGGLLAAGMAPGALVAAAMPPLAAGSGWRPRAQEIVLRVATGLVVQALALSGPTSPPPPGALPLAAALTLALSLGVTILDSGPRNWMIGSTRAEGEPDDHAGHPHHPGAHRHH